MSDQKRSLQLQTALLGLLIYSLKVTSDSGIVCPPKNPVWLKEDICSLDIVLCEAVPAVSLTLICGPCSNKTIPTQWKYVNANRTKDKTTGDNELVLLASEMDLSSAGCYECKCGNEGLFFRVNVKASVAPKFAVNSYLEEGSQRIYDIVPKFKGLDLDGEMTYPVNVSIVNCSYKTDAYPRPTVTWKYEKLNGELHSASENPCLVSFDFDQVLNVILPQMKRTFLDISYTCNVTNIAGFIIGRQTLHYNSINSYFFRPHRAQSSGNITLKEKNEIKTGTAFCSVYPNQLLSPNKPQYIICRYDPRITISNASCLAIRSDIAADDKCCICGDPKCDETLKLNTSIVFLADSAGYEARSCKVDSLGVTGDFLCLAKKFKHNLTAQYIGNFAFIHVDPPENKSISSNELTIPLKYAVPAMAGCGVIFAVMILVGVCCFKHIKAKRQKYQSLAINSVCDSDQVYTYNLTAMNSPMLKDLQKKECQLEDLIDVIPHFMADWQLIGLKLDMKTSVNNLRNNGKDNRNNCTQLFEETLEQTSLTWGRLFKILNDLGKITIIQQIERELVEKRHRSLTQSSAQTFGNGDPQQDRSTSAAARAEIEELPFDRRNTKAPSLVNEFEVASHTNGKSDASGKDGDAESDCDGDSVGSDAPLLLTSN